MNKQKILVTNGAGYIGSQACKVLQKLGFIPVTFDNLVTHWKDNIKLISFLQGDLINKAAHRSKLPKEYRLENFVSFLKTEV